MSATVLVARPDQFSGADWESLLQSQGYEVASARNGRTTLALCARLRLDFVLLIDPLPDMPGLELFRRIKSDPGNRATQVIVLPVAANESDGWIQLKTGANDDFKVGPPTSWQVLTRIHSILQVKFFIAEQAESLICSLACAIEGQKRFVTGHCARVSNTAVRFGEKLGLSHGDLNSLRIGGLLHDIGKISIPDSILLKSGPLNFRELQIVQQHTIVGERICSSVKSLRPVLPLIRHHHERIDGSGYPDRLSGEQIPLIVQVLQMVDICDALTYERSYRLPLSLPQALIVMYEEADRGSLDKELVREFATTMVGTEFEAQLSKKAANLPARAYLSTGGLRGV